MNDKPFFSVIITTYNRQGMVQKAIQSVMAQTFSDFELIIIDDGSTDGTSRHLRKYRDLRIRAISQGNQGVSHARNRGINLARADWICFLDSDDTWAPEKLAKVRQAIRQNPRVSFFHTEEIWMEGRKEMYQPQRYCRPTGKAFEEVVYTGGIDASSAVVHKRVFDAVGYFDENMPVGEDYDFWLRASFKFEVRLIPEALTVKQMGGKDQLTSRLCTDQYRIKALVKMLNSHRLNAEQYDATIDELAFQSEAFMEDAIKNNRLTRIWQHKDLLDSLMT